MMRDRAQNPPPAYKGRRHRRPEAFILLEVLVSLTIMAIALSMVMRSFTVSLRAARISERITTASILAHDLIEQWELEPPPEGETTEKFGKEHPEFSYRVQYELKQLDYEDMPGLEEGRLAFLRLVSLDVYYQPKRGGTEHRKKVLHLESALTSAERFTGKARIKNDKGFDD